MLHSQQPLACKTLNRDWAAQKVQFCLALSTKRITLCDYWFADKYRQHTIIGLV